MDPLSDIISSKTTDDFFNTQNSQNTNKRAADSGAIIPSVHNDISDEKEYNENTISYNSAKSQKMPDIPQIKSIIYRMKDQLDSILRMLNGEEAAQNTIINESAAKIPETGEKIIEGVFNGEKMIGPDGQEYNVPPNYASKSKLVEGDMMKLTITNNGKFIYKQISPIARKRITGELVPKTNGQWSVLAEGQTYKILTASVTFWKGKAGDDVVILVPANGKSSWGAVENIISK